MPVALRRQLLQGTHVGVPVHGPSLLHHPECLAGDGGFAHCWVELETARRMGLAVTLMVLNNQKATIQVGDQVPITTQ